MAYTPKQEMLEKYADVLVNFALHDGKGIKKGEVVLVWGKECTKPLYVEVCKAIWRAGGHVIDQYTTNESQRRGTNADFYKIASPAQLDFFPDKFYRGLIDQIDHQIAILGEANPYFLKDVDSKKVMHHEKAMKPFMDWRDEKENHGKFSWTLGLYGTAAMAEEAGMSEKAYWDQIIKACFLDEKNPIKKWKETLKTIHVTRDRLNKLTPQTEKLHIFGHDVDLWITLGKDRKWICGSGCNIPSFEIFTSPDWRGTEGWIRFNQPLYHHGNKIESVELIFKSGKVVKATATKNEKLLKAMIATSGADRIGEYSLTDKRLSRITKCMAETLYDENIGGPYGNTHIALGKSYHDTYAKGAAQMTKDIAEDLGFNDSSIHTDIISTTKRTVTAHLNNGSEKIIYKDGLFVI